MRLLHLLGAVALLLVTFTSSSALAKEDPVLIKFETTMGNFVVELDTENAPASSKNFEQYVRDGFYDGTIFHRVIDNFMIQGGGFDADMEQKATREPIKNEADNGLANDKYTLAMARTQDPDSATAQFFINVKDNAFLNHSGKTVGGWGYAVFGKVVEGTEIIDIMKGVKTGSFGFHQDVPVEQIAIVKAYVVE